MSAPLFRRVALIGLGLIGSSIARAAKRGGLAGEIVGHARSAATRATRPIPDSATALAPKGPGPSLAGTRDVIKEGMSRMVGIL